MKRVESPNFLSRSGLTLLECILTLALIGLISLPLATAFKITIENWDLAHKDDDLLNHGRMAMARMISDLRYGAAFIRADNLNGDSYLQFYTRTLEDSDWELELISYWRLKDKRVLYRQVLGIQPTGLVLAGTQTPRAIVVDYFGIFPMKKVGGVLVPMIDGESLDLAVAVKLILTMKDTSRNRSLDFTSLARLRNK